MRPPETGRIEVFDSLLPGFGLRLSSRGHKAWILFYRYGGNQRRKTFPFASFPRLEDARDRAREILGQVERGVDPEAETREATAPLVTEAIAEFIMRYAKVRNRDWRTTERLLQRHVGTRWPDRRVQTIRRTDILKMLDELGDAGYRAGANRVLAATRKLFAWLVERGEIEQSPVAGVTAPAKEQRRDRVLSEAELVRVWIAAEVQAYPMGQLVQLLILLGQRRTMTANMRWRDLDLEEGVWRVPAEAMKGGRPHVVPLPSSAVALLTGSPRHSEYVLSTNGVAPVSGYSKVKAILDERLGPEIAPWRLHDIRRSVATRLAELGTPRIVIERLLDHADRSVTSRYDQHTYLPEVRRALETWSKRLEELLAASRG
ncbi:MAG: tyrosine-type recombinase/integrase [Rhodospirillales bacterium]|nr:tyrosine-type recombinase/integrase [Rhodospirillales bacterium]